MKVEKFHLNSVHTYRHLDNRWSSCVRYRRGDEMAGRDELEFTMYAATREEAEAAALDVAERAVTAIERDLHVYRPAKKGAAK